MLAVAAVLALQAASSSLRASTPVPSPAPAPAVAAQVAASNVAGRPPVIDGRDADAAWATATRITDFFEVLPREGAEPRLRTEARIAYDRTNLYVFVRAFDPRPDSVTRALARRDTETPADQLKLIVDSYHDRRTGWEFAVNPAGVKRDYSIINDLAASTDEDVAWDAVWDVATEIDSLGWTAEFRIPLSQLRVAAGAAAFGFGIVRDIHRHAERVSWPLYRPSQAGVVSQLGAITFAEPLRAVRLVELTPYASSRAASGMPGGASRSIAHSVGGDFKLGLGEGLIVDGAVNPDFGQVEADPATLNLSAFETLQQERRPFFVSATSQLSRPINCSRVNCAGEGLFYSRRIGRAPQLRSGDTDPDAPRATSIVGSAMLSGRLHGGLKVAALGAITARVADPAGRTLEPSASYTALRLQQDTRAGRSGWGLLVTGVSRRTDRWSDSTLRRSAFVAATDARYRFDADKYQISGLLARSDVGGSARAIAATQRSSVHYLQQPGAQLTYDSTRTHLVGHSAEFNFAKVGGGRIRFETDFLLRSSGFETNDLGFLWRAGHQNWNTWGELQYIQPTRWYRALFWRSSWWQEWNSAGLPLAKNAMLNVSVQLPNAWWVYAAASRYRVGGPGLCDVCARGGPVLAVDPYSLFVVNGEGDARLRVRPALTASVVPRIRNGGAWASVTPRVTVRVSDQLITTLIASASQSTEPAQWFGLRGDAAGANHYTFARLDQVTASISARVDYSVTPNLTAQLYVAPFVSRGEFSNVRELSEPRARDFFTRYLPYSDTLVARHPGGFVNRQFNSNLVFRWEYRPGSALFLVWGRAGAVHEDQPGNPAAFAVFRSLLGDPVENVLQFKVSFRAGR